MRDVIHAFDGMSWAPFCLRWSTPIFLLRRVARDDAGACAALLDDIYQAVNGDDYLLWYKVRLFIAADMSLYVHGQVGKSSGLVDANTAAKKDLFP